ncbi:outer membrane beta-barrel family protein [Segatella copri]|uniref:outer membrane beta-barrel family protein n=1 Tax=Segatella copri TaxID=165179 RepID=UPI00294AF070|nr:outer membrane beta-barrel family protein [Segatella copri]WOF86829.1 outer membrane beta-barrel family protein [Segatella copri]WOF93083.1 outer membrane beta-barrel family protein [Segatella copri]
MKQELIMSGLLILGNQMMANAQQTKTTTIESVSTENISTDSIQAMREKLRQDSIQWEKQLAAVTIKGTRSQFRQKNGGIVARISGTSLEKEPNATEVLAKLPGMFKDKDGKPQAFIGGAPEIYINDRKVQDYSIVENLPVTQIKEVKVIHHPGAEYGNNVGCVLLITTKKNLQGLAIVENSGVLFDSFVSNNHDLDLTYTHGKMTYYGKLGYANWQGYWKEQDITTNYVSGSQAGSNTGNNAGSNTGSNATSYIASSTLDCKHSYNDHFYWSAGADLALTEKQTIGVKYDGYNIHQPMPFKMTSYAMTNDHVDDNVTGNNKFLYYDWQHHVNAFYQGKFGEKWKLNFFGDFVKLHTEQAQFVDEISEREARNKFTLLPQSDGTIWGAKARANYTINDKQTWMMGTEYNYVKSESRADYTPADKGTSTHSITKENHAAVFAEYSIDFKPFSLRVGLRYEHVDSRLNYLKDETGTTGTGTTGTPETASTEPLHRTYDNFYPSLLLSHQAGRFSQSLSYRSSETRPSFQELNTGTVYANRYMRQVGNSELEPSQRHEFQYQASYGDLFLQASYTYVKNYITSIIDPDSDDPQTGYITWTNIDHCWNWGSFLGYRHRWGFYEPQVQAGIQQGFINAISMGKEKSFHDPYYIFSLYNGFHLPKGWYMNLSFSYRSSGTYDFVTISSVHNFDFQLYKSFLKDKLSLSLNVSDIFNTRRQKTDGTYDNVRFQQQKWEDTRSVQLRLTYRFNQAKKQYRGENSAQEAVGRMGGK